MDDSNPEIEDLRSALDEGWDAKKAAELASLLTNRGGKLSNEGHLAEALGDLSRAVEIFERLVQEGQREVEPKLAISRMNRGITLCGSGELKDGAEEFDKAVALCQRLVEVEGRQELNDLLGMAQRNQAFAQQELAGGGRRAPSPQGSMYDPGAVQPMREELTRVGMQELLTADDVERHLGAAKGTALLVINSVCGCAAGGARPGVRLALQNAKIPDHLTTVFAGMDRDAVENARGLLSDYPPSSPCIALFKDGAVVAMHQRQDIEGRAPEEIAARLVADFDVHCTRPGPSISPEEFAKLTTQPGCGSSVPRAGS